MMSLDETNIKYSLTQLHRIPPDNVESKNDENINVENKNDTYTERKKSCE
jgi:hypothetical protein